jgi:hypothetical protein
MLVAAAAMSYFVHLVVFVLTSFGGKQTETVDLNKV